MKLKQFHLCRQACALFYIFFIIFPIYVIFPLFADSETIFEWFSNWCYDLLHSKNPIGDPEEAEKMHQFKENFKNRVLLAVGIEAVILNHFFMSLVDAMPKRKPHKFTYQLDLIILFKTALFFGFDIRLLGQLFYFVLVIIAEWFYYSTAQTADATTKSSSVQRVSAIDDPTTIELESEL